CAGAHRTDLRMVRRVAAADARRAYARGAACQGSPIPRPHSRARCGTDRVRQRRDEARPDHRPRVVGNREWGIGNREEEFVIDVAIVGAGPWGLAAGISARRAGLDALVFDAEFVVSSITHYPTYATFFSTAEKLSLGGLPFVTPGEKPSRRDALAYYRTVVRYFDIPVRQYERGTRIGGCDGAFVVHTNRRGVEHVTEARAVIVATGYWGSPNRLGVPGE